MASAKILYFTHKELKDGSHPIVLQVIHNRERRLISLGHSVQKSLWDYDNNLPSKKHPNYRGLKTLMLDKLSQAEKVILDLDDKNKPYTLEDVVSQLKVDKKSKYVFKYTEDLVSKMTKAGSIGNARVYENALSVFKKYRKEKDLEFNDLSYKVLQDFIDYLKGEGCKTNTISVYLRTLRAIYNRAIKEKAAQEALYPFKKLKIKSEKTRKRAISKEDINKIRELDLEEESELDKARDYFLFSFNMRGMNFVDMAYLQVKDIVDGRVNYSRQKTKQKFSIKITDEAWKIINKYSDLEDKDSYIFPILRRRGKEFLDYRNALRLTNKKLKIIGENAGSSIPISTYVSRHAWATIAKRLGTPTAVISEGLGHDSELTTQIYLDSFGSEVLDDANEEITK